MISTTITSRESTQTQRCYLRMQIPSRIKFKWVTCMKTFMLISICSTFPGEGNKVRDLGPSSMMVKKKVICKIKGELNREIIEDFVSLKVKMYSVKTKNKEMKKTKGVKRNVLKKYISHLDYEDCLFEERKFIHTMQSILSFKHLLHTIKQNKVSLSPYDHKQYLLHYGVNSLPYGHFTLL